MLKQRLVSAVEVQRSIRKDEIEPSLGWGARAASPQLSAACRQHFSRNEIRLNEILGKLPRLAG